MNNFYIEKIRPDEIREVAGILTDVFETNPALKRTVIITAT
jgi:hypothetical protein